MGINDVIDTTETFVRTSLERALGVIITGIGMSGNSVHHEPGTAASTVPDPARGTRASSPSSRPARFPRFLIERVTPDLDGGRYAVKLIIGELLDVEASIVKDGQDLIGAQVCYRGPGDQGWRSAPSTVPDN